MRVALIQMDSGPNKKENIKKACAMITKCSEKNPDLVLLPEVFNYRGPLFGKNLYNEIGEHIPGPSIAPLMEIAKKNSLNVIAGSIYEKSNDHNKVYNSSILINKSGKIISKYRKINLFRAFVDGREIDEAITFKPGIEETIVNIDKVKFGLSICFDLRFPDLFRKYYQKGVDVIAIPSSFTHSTGLLHWEVLLRARAIENHCYVLASNQVGYDGNGVKSYGNSMIIDFNGKVIKAMDDVEEGIIYSDLTFKGRKKFFR